LKSKKSKGEIANGDGGCMRIEPPVNDPKLKSSEVKRKKAGKKDGVRSSSSSSFVGMLKRPRKKPYERR